MDELIARAPAGFRNNGHRPQNLVSNCPPQHPSSKPLLLKVWSVEQGVCSMGWAAMQTYWKEAVFLIRSAGESHAHYSLGSPGLKEVSLFSTWLVTSC